MNYNVFANVDPQLDPADWFNILGYLLARSVSAAASATESGATTNLFSECPVCYYLFCSPSRNLLIILITIKMNSLI